MSGVRRCSLTVLVNLQFPLLIIRILLLSLCRNPLWSLFFNECDPNNQLLSRTNLQKRSKKKDKNGQRPTEPEDSNSLMSSLLRGSVEHPVLIQNKVQKKLQIATLPSNHPKTVKLTTLPYKFPSKTLIL